MNHSSTPKVSNNGIHGKTRVTLVIPDVLDRNIEAYSLREGLLKNQVVTAALEKFLRDHGLQPDKPPKVSLSY